MPTNTQINNATATTGFTDWQLGMLGLDPTNPFHKPIDYQEPYEPTDKDHARACMAMDTPAFYTSFHSFKFGSMQMEVKAWEVPGAADDGEWTVMLTNAVGLRRWGTYYIDCEHHVWGVSRNDLQVMDQQCEIVAYLRSLAYQAFHVSTIEPELWEEN